jgi:CelD/BcsL family acetyltransferase involved in cellulose biosynthesis
VAVALAESLAHGHLLPELRVPRVRLDGDRSASDHLSRNTRKALRRARNRIDSAGMTMQIAFEQDPRAIAELLDEVELVHRKRDHDQRRSSDLDSPAGQRFWRETILDHAERGEAELATLRLDGRLAAYVVALLDGSTYRVFDGRCDSHFAPFSPGRLVEAATLERALTDERFDELDWMSGVGPEKLLTENASQARVRFIASSADRDEADCLGCRADAVLLTMGS